MTLKSIMRMAALYVAVAGLSACTAQAPQTAKDTSMAETAPSYNTLSGEPPLIIAHRGASGLRPEHTLEAYQLAIDLGADFIEPDLVMTKDGVLIARHDRYLSTSTNVADRPEFESRRRADPAGGERTDWWAEDFTLAEIKTLRARQPFTGRDTAFDNQFTIPTFTEIIDLAEQSAREGRPVGLYPETKSPSHHKAAGLDMTAPLLDALNRSDIGALDIPVFFQSFEQGILSELKAESDYKLVQLLTGDIDAIAAGYEPVKLQQVIADGIGPSKHLLWRGETAIPNSTVKVAHELGLTVHPWTLRADQVDPRFDSFDAELAALIEQGVDGFFTDHPGRARQSITPK